MIDELGTPASVLGAATAVEIVRAWIVGEDVSFVTRDIWEDPAAVGIFVADLLRHMADPAHEGGDAAVERERRAIDGLRAELNI
jgi:hypothetical protein